MTAHLLKSKVDSLIRINKSMPKIVIMGDFNDTPFDNSILNVLSAKPFETFSDSDTLINLFAKGKDLDNEILEELERRLNIG